MMRTGRVGKPACAPARVASRRAGAANAALLAVSILALDDPLLRERLVAFRAAQTDRVWEPQTE
jgi:5-(carboxyamino)imidazole ribonucleotide mutase